MSSKWNARKWGRADQLIYTGEFPSQMPVTQSFDVFFDLRLEYTF